MTGMGGMPRARVDAGDDVERRLASTLAAGDRAAALELLVDAYGELIYQYCRRIMGNDADGDDVSQVVFMQAFEGIEKVAEADSARAWLRAIARNRCLDRLKALRRAPRPVEDAELERVADVAGIDELAVDDARTRKALDDCLDRLDARSRTTLVLRFQDQLSYEEIGKLTADTPGALRVRVARALPALRDCLGSKGVSP